jgi:hypothetical protein
LARDILNGVSFFGELMDVAAKVSYYLEKTLHTPGLEEGR